MDDLLRFPVGKCPKLKTIDSDQLKQWTKAIETARCRGRRTRRIF